MKLTKTILNYDAIDVIAESALYGLKFAQSQNNTVLFDYHLAVGAVWRASGEVDADREIALRYADQQMVIEYHAEGTPMIPDLLKKLKDFKNETNC
ncbi:hypothetical protein CCP4SC76_2490011 [Gammaproteobacteria bacterium]